MSVLFSASERYLRHAAQALRHNLPGASVVELAPEVGRVSGDYVTMSRVHRECVGGPGDRDEYDLGVPFVRHLAAEDEVVPTSELDMLPAVVARMVGQLSPAGQVAEVGREGSAGQTGDVGRAGEAGRPGEMGHVGEGGQLGEVALQVWSSGQVPQRAPDLREQVDSALRAQGVRTTRGSQPWVVTVCLTPAGASVGLNRRDEVLADWPGGRMVLGRPPQQVSRAEWKLEEMFKLGALPGPPAETEGRPLRALDLGAAPGGWTRILRSQGYEVWAVDPGELHPRVAADPGVHHVVTTAGRFLAASAGGASAGGATAGGEGGVGADGVPGQFDLVVNDMRMAPEHSCRVMVQAAPRLRPAGLAVMTLKVSPARPMPTVERSLALLAGPYRPRLVRQLYHNKNEVTVVAVRVPSTSV